MLTNSTTQMPSTIATYERIAKTLFRRADRLTAAGYMGAISDPERLIACAYADAEPMVCKATARLYHAAAVYWVKANLGPHTYDALEMLCPEPSQSDYFHAEKIAKKRSELTCLRGAQQKAKWLDQADWTKLIEALAARSNVWSTLSIDWLLGGLCTGLRPCEWRNTNWQADTLTVANAKATNERSHGITRTLDLTRSSTNERQVVERLSLHLSSMSDEAYKEAYNGVRNLIRRVAREIFPRRELFPTLYTARHVFAARAKATWSPAWVAALMGHASIRTAQTHYARAHRARDGRPLEVEPSAADVAAVCQRILRAQTALAFIHQATR